MHTDDLAPSTTAATQATSDGFRCEACGVSFDALRKLSAHKWSKHGTRSGIRQLVGDTCVCPVCGTDFKTRARLIKHLLERRVRSKCRKVSCQSVFLGLKHKVVPADVLAGLEARSAVCASASRKEGHTSIVATTPCQRTKPSVLKRAKRATAT